MKITYELTPQDIFEHARESAVGTRERNVNVTFIVMIALAFIFGDAVIAGLEGKFFDEDGFSFVYLIVRVIGCAVVMVGLYLAIRLLAGRKVKEIERTDGPNGVFCEHVIELRDDGFSEETTVNKTFQSWKGVTGIDEAASYITIGVRMTGGHIIPKRAFSSPEEAREFVTAARRYLQESNAL